MDCTAHGVAKSWTCLSNFHFTSYLAIQGFPGDAVVKNMSASVGDATDVGLIPVLKDPLEKEMTTYSSILASKIPWTVEPGRLLGSKEPDMT